MSGFPDFPKWDGRYKQVLRSVARKNTIKRNYPFNLELLRLTDIDLGPIEERSAHDKAVYDALTMGFFFLFRASEMEGLRMCDVNLDRQDGIVHLNVFLTGSKTDQYNQGDSKRLMEIGGNLRPIRALIRWARVCNWDPNSKENYSQLT